MDCKDPKSSRQVGGTFAQGGPILVGHPRIVWNEMEKKSGEIPTDGGHRVYFSGKAFKGTDMSKEWVS